MRNRLVSRESREARRARAAAVFERLDAAMPEAKIALDYASELELLVSVILSAQSTDAMVNRVTPALFARFRTAADYARATPAAIGRHIRRVGLWRAKARAIVAAMRHILAHHAGRLPRTRALLEQLPGVGRKTAGVVLLHAFGTPAFPVDTHVGRIARRLGFSRETNPDRVEQDLCALYPAERWGHAHHLLIWHGRRTCKAPRPLCESCAVAALCPKLTVPAASAARRPGRARAPA